MRTIFFILLMLNVCLPISLYAQTTDIVGPTGSGKFGTSVVILNNGNYVITDPNYDEGGIVDIGAVYLYNGATHSLISVVKGITANDKIGALGITALPNSNYIIRSHSYDNGSIADAGAVTWCDGNLGLNGTINSSNSLVGGSAGDFAGITGITILPNNNYLVRTAGWDNGAITNAGAVTWGNGATGVSGLISSSNSLVGSTASDQVGGTGITILANGNYVVRTMTWNNVGAADAGAVTWGNGATGTSGIISASNSLVGTTTNDNVGNTGVMALTNGNYVVASGNWNNGSISNAGAATWGDGNVGVSGAVSISNSLVGTSSGDQVGLGYIIPLSNGNYVVRSYSWKNVGAEYAGAVTWGNGTVGVKGAVSSSNSWVGTSSDDQVGASVIALNNGHYVIASPLWDNGSNANVGAVTWGNGTTGSVGIVGTSNSWVGNANLDRVGYNIYALNTGNCVIASRYWTNTTGAVTWLNGSTSTSGVVSSLNSLVGNAIGDNVGNTVTPLPNGNYVIQSPFWDNGAITNVGAVTLGNGIGGTIGTINSSNSLIGNAINDAVGDVNPLTILSNGNYVVGSKTWKNGAVAGAGAATWCSATTPTVGFISASNSIVGDKYFDQVGTKTTALSNGNYVVYSLLWTNGQGAATWGNGATGTACVVSSSNSLIGSTAGDRVGKQIIPLSNGNYLVGSDLWDNGTIVDAGFYAWGNGLSGVSGIVSSSNALVGNSTADQVSSLAAIALPNGNYIVHSQLWNNGTILDGGACTVGNGATGTNGRINSCNSVLGNLAYSGNSMSYGYNSIYNYYLIGKLNENKVSIFLPATQSLATHLDTHTQNVTDSSALAFVSGNCRLIATLQANGTSPASGNTTAKVWVESTQSPIYVKRHYQIQPASGSTGRVSLYFTQSEFDDFNNQSPAPALLLPQNPTDATGKAHLYIQKYGGTSNDGSGLPTSYSGTVETIDPLDTDIVWNVSKNSWEISFDVSSFSGFFVQTQLTPLPITSLSFDAANKGNYNLIQWQTTDEGDNMRFEVERSEDALTFAKIGAFAGKGQNMNHYELKDEKLFAEKYDYRIKQIDIEGHFQYSETLSVLVSPEKIMTIYPNPTQDKVYLRAVNRQQNILLSDALGKILYQSPEIPQEIDLSAYPNGIYFLRTQNTQVKIIKVN